MYCIVLLIANQYILFVLVLHTIQTQLRKPFYFYYNEFDLDRHSLTEHYYTYKINTIFI